MTPEKLQILGQILFDFLTSKHEYWSSHEYPFPDDDPEYPIPQFELTLDGKVAISKEAYDLIQPLPDFWNRIDNGSKK